MLRNLVFTLVLLACLCSQPSGIAAQIIPDNHRIESAVLQLVSEIQLPAAANGPIREVLVREGSLVEKDQLLVTINDEQAQSQLEESLIELDIVKQQAKSEVDINFALKSKQVAMADYRRAQQSNRKYAGVVSDREMDRLKLLVEKSDAELEQIRFEKNLLEKQVELKMATVKKHRYEVRRHQVRATISGQIVELNKRQGEWVNIADPILKLVQLDKLKVDDFLPAEVATRQLVSSAATFQPDLPVGSESISGEVVFVSPTIDPLNSKVKVRIEFENPGLILRPGMKGVVTIMSATGAPTETLLQHTNNGRPPTDQ